MGACKKLPFYFQKIPERRESLDCGGGCENCSSCWLGGGSPWDIYQDYIEGKREIREINEEYAARHRHDKQVK